jgi:hypothetical protein
VNRSPRKENPHEEALIGRAKEYEQHARDSFTQPRHNSKVEEYDLVILGGGTRSTVAAWDLCWQKDSGQPKLTANTSVSLVPTSPAFPATTSSTPAKVASYVRRSAEYGIARDGLTTNMSAVRDRKRRMVSGVNQMYLNRNGRNAIENDHQRRNTVA